MKKIRKIKISELKPGMVLAEDVDSSHGAFWFTRGTKVDEKIIAKIRNSDYNYVKIFEEIEKEEEINYSRIYFKNVNRISNFFDIVSNEQDFSYNLVENLVEETMDFKSPREIVNLLNKIEKTDEYTHTHSINVGILSLMFGRWLNLSEEKLVELLYAGILHDIGKARIPEKILKKKGSLTEKEMDIVKKHPEHSFDILNNNRNEYISDQVCYGVLFHHERKDGSGYPMGLEKKKIPLFARIISIVDTYAAMTSNRVYKRAEPPFSVLEFLNSETHSVFDLSLLDVFTKNIAKYYEGKLVKLSDGRAGTIVFVYPDNPNYPIVKVDDKFIDLYRSELSIEDVVQ